MPDIRPGTRVLVTLGPDQQLVEAIVREVSPAGRLCVEPVFGGLVARGRWVARDQIVEVLPLDALPSREPGNGKDH